MSVQADAASRNNDVYLKTVERMEPDIAFIDAAAYNSSAAISLKRIADNLDYIVSQIKKEDEKRGK